MELYGSKCKVYTLLPDGSWHDSGTGFSTVEVDHFTDLDGSQIQTLRKLCVHNDTGGIAWELLLSEDDSLRRQHGM
jgi:hypothetical protein